MSELRRHGRELLEASRRERTPPPEVKERLLQSLLETAAQMSLAADEAPPLSQRLSFGAKALVLGGLVLTILGATWLASR
jgi:hypothetical protein